MAQRKKKIRVLVVDDHPCVLRGIQAYFKTKPHIKIIGQAREGVEAIQKAKKLSPDVVLMDLSLPNMHGVEALRRICAETRRAKLIAYTMHESRAYAQQAIGAGAAGYVLKSSPLAVLARAIERVEGGETFFDPNVSACLPLASDKHRVVAKQAKPGGLGGRDIYSLTRKEREILESLVEGLSTKEIAQQHHISFHTAVSHLRNIYNKFGVHKRSAALLKALGEQMIQERE